MVTVLQLVQNTVDDFLIVEYHQIQWCLVTFIRNCVGVVTKSNILSECANEQNVDQVEDIFQLVEPNPSTSRRRIFTRIGIPHTRVWWTLKFTVD